MKSVAVAIPAYNEEGLPGFLAELDEALRPLARKVSFHVIDDASTTDMREKLKASAGSLSGQLNVGVNPENRGHGPTLMRAYAAALNSGAEMILQVDGDGQFRGEDVRLLLQEIVAGADVAIGVRQIRIDPWFRKLLSRSLRSYLRILTGVRSQDANCPFRIYRRTTLHALLGDVPAEALVPSVYLTVLSGTKGFAVAEVPVEHRVRRGIQAQGTMWGRRQRRLLVPKRLMVFVMAALRESLVLRGVLKGRRASSSDVTVAYEAEA